jgi:hypothetical protein
MTRLLAIQESENRICDLLRRIRYKPGWNISFQRGPSIGYETFYFVIDYVAFEFFASEQEAQVHKCSYILERSCGFDPPSVGKFRFTYEVPDYQMEFCTEAQIVEWIINAIKMAEDFELKRWLRINGVNAFTQRR